MAWRVAATRDITCFGMRPYRMITGKLYTRIRRMGWVLLVTLVSGMVSILQQFHAWYCIMIHGEVVQGSVCRPNPPSRRPPRDLNTLRPAVFAIVQSTLNGACKWAYH